MIRGIQEALSRLLAVFRASPLDQDFDEELSLSRRSLSADVDRSARCRSSLAHDRRRSPGRRERGRSPGW